LAPAAPLQLHVLVRVSTSVPHVSVPGHEPATVWQPEPAEQAVTQHPVPAAHTVSAGVHAHVSQSPSVSQILVHEAFA
jgi:hypothetical protein